MTYENIEYRVVKLKGTKYCIIALFLFSWFKLQYCNDVGMFFHIISTLKLRESKITN